MTKLRSIIFILVAMAIVYTGVRSTVITNAERALRTEIRALKDRGITVKIKSIKQAGFPYRIELALKGVTVKDKAGTYDIEAGTVNLISHVWTPNHWMLVIKGADVHLLDRAIEFTDNSMTASYKTHEDGKRVIVLDSVDGADFTLNRFPGLRQKATSDNWVFSAVLHPDQASDTTLYEQTIADFRFQMIGGKIGNGKAAHEAIAGMELSGSLTGTGLTRWHKGEARDWGLNGGLIKINALNMALKDTAFGASGTLSLDQNLNLLGSMSFKIQGNKTLAGILSNGGLINSSRSQQAIANAPEKADTSIMLQSGAILLGNTMIARTDPVFD